VGGRISSNLSPLTRPLVIPDGARSAEIGDLVQERTWNKVPGLASLARDDEMKTPSHRPPSRMRGTRSPGPMTSVLAGKGEGHGPRTWPSANPGMGEGTRSRVSLARARDDEGVVGASYSNARSA
jgi:hypothetical protein